MKLFVVIKDRSLLWPEDFPEDDRFRGGEGYVVDMDAPYEKKWCESQEAKLRPATKKEIEEGLRPTPITSPIAHRAITAFKEGAGSSGSIPASSPSRIPLPDDAIREKAVDSELTALRKEVASLKEQVQTIAILVDYLKDSVENDPEVLAEQLSEDKPKAEPKTPLRKRKKDKAASV